MIFADGESNRTGTRFWPKAPLRIKCPYTLTEVYKTERVQVKHRVHVIDPSNISTPVKVPIQTVVGAGAKELSVRLPTNKARALGMWTIQHEIISVRDSDGNSVTEDRELHGQPFWKNEGQLKITVPKIKPDPIYHIQAASWVSRQSPQLKFDHKKDKGAAIRLEYKLIEVPVNTSYMLAGSLFNAASGKRLPFSFVKRKSASEGLKGEYGHDYYFTQDDHDSPFMGRIRGLFFRGGRIETEYTVDLGWRNFSLTGNPDPNVQTLQPVSVATRKVDFVMWDHGGSKDDVVKISVDGRPIRIRGPRPDPSLGITDSYALFLGDGRHHGSFTIPPNQDSVVFRIENVASPDGPNTAAIEFTGAIEQDRRAQEYSIPNPTDEEKRRGIKKAVATVVTLREPQQNPGGSP